MGGVNMRHGNEIKSREIMIEIKGQTKSLWQWAHDAGLNLTTVRCRYKRGVRGEALIAPPVRGNPLGKLPAAITINGETRSLRGWSIVSGISIDTIAHRVQSGWPNDQILTPTGRERKSCEFRDSEEDCDWCPYPDCIATSEQALRWDKETGRGKLRQEEARLHAATRH